MGKWPSFGAGDRQKVQEVSVAGDGVRDLLGIIVLGVGVWWLVERDDEVRFVEKKGGEKRQWQDDSGSYIIVRECGNLGSPVDRRFSVAAPLRPVATTKHETNTYFSRGPKLGPAARSAVGRPTATSQDHPSARCDVTRVTTEPAHWLLRNFCSDAVENSIRLVSFSQQDGLMSKVGYQASTTIVQHIMNGEEAQPNKLIKRSLCLKTVERRWKNNQQRRNEKAQQNSIHNECQPLTNNYFKTYNCFCAHVF